MEIWKVFDRKLIIELNNFLYDISTQIRTWAQWLLFMSLRCVIFAMWHSLSVNNRCRKVPFLLQLLQPWLKSFFDFARVCADGEYLTCRQVANTSILVSNVRSKQLQGWLHIYTTMLHLQRVFCIQTSLVGQLPSLGRKLGRNILLASC